MVFFIPTRLTALRFSVRLGEKTRLFRSMITRTAFAGFSTTLFPTTSSRTCRAMSLLSWTRMRKPLQDTPTMRGVCRRSKRTLPAVTSPPSTRSDIVSITTMQTRTCTISRADTMIRRWEDLLAQIALCKSTFPRQIAFHLTFMYMA